jgi:hypothetical protein
LLKSGLAALERGRRSAREQLGRTAIAYVVLAVALVLTGLAYYHVRHNVEQVERQLRAGSGPAHAHIHRRDARREGALRRQQIRHARRVEQLRRRQRARAPLSRYTGDRLLRARAP